MKIRKSFIILFFTLSFFSFGHLASAIIAVHDLALFQKNAVKLTPKDLAVFDVDHTLIAYDDQVLRPAGETFRQQLLQGHLSKEKPKEYYMSIVMEDAPESLLDPEFKNIIDDLHRRNIPAIALTAVKSQPYGIISNLVDWRARHLHRLGIDFSKPHYARLELSQFQGKGPSPVFESGILFSGNYPKGDVLAAFLAEIEWKPRTLLFIDDNRNFIESVEKALDKIAVPTHISFYYQAVDALPGHLDAEIAQFQLETLLRDEKWVGDCEAKELLEAKRCASGS